MRKLDTKKISYIVIFLFIAGAVILIASGTFYEPPVVSTVNQGGHSPNDGHDHGNNTNPSDPHGGADMTKLQQINDLQKKFDNNPNDFNTLLDLAHLLNDSGFKERAIEKYKIYLESKPNTPDVLVDMGVCYYEMGDAQNAITYMEKAVQIEPNHQIGNLNLGIVNFSIDNKTKALEWWRKALKIDPNSQVGQRAQTFINQVQIQ